MILCLDAGNTRLKWGLHDGDAWLAQGACAHVDCAGLAAGIPAGCTRILACNVAGDTVAAHIKALAASLNLPLAWFRSTAACCEVTNGYANPSQLGADRWAALIGARRFHAGPALVVTAGTATTIDLLTAAGHFAGGLILPGLELMRQALARNTAALPAAQGTYCDVPTNTDDAIVSGILHATLGAIERMALRLSPTTTKADFLCVLSGGSADLIEPHFQLPHLHIEHLALEGLARAAWSPPVNPHFD